MSVGSKVTPFATFEGWVQLIPLRAIIEPRGRLIEIDFDITPTLGTAAGDLIINGNPFTPSIII